MSSVIPASGLHRVSFTDLVDLACENVGGEAVWANDEFFAGRVNLLKASAAVFVPDKYDDHGKWMDGWETRRRRSPGHDSCVIKLGIPGVIRGVNVDTAYFVGNYPEYCSIEALCADSLPAGALANDGGPWKEILPKTLLNGGTFNTIAISSSERWTHLRLKIFPDGGVARLRVHGEARPDWSKIGAQSSQGGGADLAALVNGGTVVTCNDHFFGPKDNLILPGRAKTMGGGWETRRKRGPGHDWIIVKLGRGGKLRKIEVDTNHYQGNFPESCSMDGLTSSEDLLACDFRDRTDLTWVEILPKSNLQASHQHYFEKELKAKSQTFQYVRLNIYPDGGISRLRVYGEPNA